MTKGLKALENIKREAGTPYFSTLYDIDMWKEDFATVEKELKDYERRLELAKEYKDINNVAKRLNAFEIITSRKTNIAMLFWFFKYKPNYEKYVEAFSELSSDFNEEMLTKDEYEFLKGNFYDKK